MAAVISVIVLAAGESKRMGQPKLLLSLSGSTILEQTIDNFLGSAASEVIVVVGDRAQAMTNLIAGRPVKVAVNLAYHQGMSTSIASGLGLISPKSQAVMLVLADQPFVDSLTVNHLIAAWDSHNQGIAVPVYRGRRGHPVIFAIKYKAALLRLKGDVGAKEIIRQHPDDILEVAVDCAGINLDIDTISTYSSVRKKPGGVTKF